MTKKLNPKQLKFVQEYLLSGNATEAAKKAGYSEKTAYSQGHDLLKNPEISKTINDNKDKALKELNITQKEILEAIYKMATFSPADVLEWKNGKLVFKDGFDLKLLDGAGFTIYPEYQTKDDIKKKMIRARLSIHSNDRKEALRMLGEHVNLWKDKDAGAGNNQESRKDLLSRVSKLIRKNIGGETGGGSGTASDS